MSTLNPSILGGFTPRSSLINDRLREATLRQLSQLSWGTLQIREPERGLDQCFGSQLPDQPNATITIKDSAVYAMLAFGRDIGAGQAWAEGLWDADDLTAALRIFLHGQNGQSEPLQSRLSAFSRPLLTRLHRSRANSKHQARRNIAAHYDLGNDFFSAWLDPTMFYSSAVYPSSESSLEQGQFEKADRICRKLRLQAGQQLLEIGTGWGAFAIHAAREYGVHVTTTTISQAQYDYAQAAVKREGLEDKISLLLRDYRELEGSFDAIVSIEMIEAVGHQYFDTYFRKLGELLKPEGQALIQSITTPDHSYQDYQRGTDFIRHFIFPGGSLPSLTAIHDSFSRVSDLRLYHLEDIGPHYARTLKHWYQRFSASLEHIPQANQDPWFIRLWSFYLCVCEALFEERRCGCAQLHLVRPMARPEPLLLNLGR